MIKLIGSAKVFRRDSCKSTVCGDLHEKALQKLILFSVTNYGSINVC